MNPNINDIDSCGQFETEKCEIDLIFFLTVRNLGEFFHFTMLFRNSQFRCDYSEKKREKKYFNQIVIEFIIVKFNMVSLVKKNILSAIF